MVTKTNVVKHTNGSYFKQANAIVLAIQTQQKYNLLKHTCSRSRSSDAVSRNPQLPVQAGTAPRSAIHIPGQARLGPVLLQGGPQGDQWTHPQEPTSLHRHEPYRSQP